MALFYNELWNPARFICSQDHFKALKLLCCEAIVRFLQPADRAWNTEYAAQVYHYSLKIFPVRGIWEFQKLQGK